MPCINLISRVIVSVQLVQLPLSASTEEISSPPASRKGGKGGGDTAAGKRRSKGGKGTPKAKRVKYSKGDHETNMWGKRREGYRGKEDLASFDQSSNSSDEGSYLGKDCFFFFDGSMEKGREVVWEKEELNKIGKVVFYFTRHT